jgi:serine/threonine protein kinase
VRLSNLVYVFRSKFVSSFVLVKYIARGAFSPFTSSGRMFIFYRLLRLGTQQADKINIGMPQKKEPGRESESRGGPSFKGFNFRDIRRRFMGGSSSEDYSREPGAPPRATDQASSERSSEGRGQVLVGSRTQAAIARRAELEAAAYTQAQTQLLEEVQDFPLLNNRREIIGRRGRYRVTDLLGVRGKGRIYKSIQISENKPVIIKEYLMPGHIFNRAEVELRKQEFMRLAGVNLGDGKAQDFRLIGAFEAIADDTENRCYLVTKGHHNFGQTLKDVLIEDGPMSDRQVHEVLKQVLQTLEFLHLHKFRLGHTQQVQRGLVHNNISLDSVLFVPCAAQQRINDQQFFVYLTDLGIWEHLFEPPTSKKIELSTPDYQPQVDMFALGRLCFCLLLGREIDEATQLPLDPRNKALWPPNTDSTLKNFLLRLIGVNGSFDTVDAARQALPPLPAEKIFAPPEETEEEEQKRKSNLKQKILMAVGGTLALGLLGGVAWWGFNQWSASQKRATETAEAKAVPCCIQNIEVPEEKFTYASQSNDIWNYVLKHPGLVAFGKTLEQELSTRLPNFKLTYKPAKSFDQALEQLRSSQLDFLVTTLPEDPNALGQLKADFETETIAYDGLTVFVAFSDEHRDRNLAKAIQGRLSYEQLRQLYTGRIKNWREMGGPDIPVKLYMPNDPRLVQLFEQRIFAEHPNELEQFRKLQYSSILQKDATQTLREVLQDFELYDVGSVGFDAFSKVFGQCSVYPLAIGQTAKSTVQALVEDSGKPVDPKSDLCDDKGSYWLDTQTFAQRQGYPLGYEVAVIYRRGGNAASPGQKFAEIWRTKEGKTLLKAAGLVPAPFVPSALTNARR